MPTINFLKVPAKITQNTNIYQIKRVLVTEKQILNKGRIFRMPGDINRYEVKKSPNVLSYKEGNSEIQICSVSGAMRHIDKSIWQIDDGKSKLVIDDREAEEIAMKYIKETKLVPASDCSLLKVTRLKAGTLEKSTGAYEERVIDVGVVFQRMLGGVPVEGPGGKVVVYLDHNKQVTGVYRLWRDLGPVVRAVQYEKLVSPKFAQDHLTKYWKNAPVQNIDVTDARFGYFELGEGVSQKYLQPAYIMPLTMSSPDGKFVMTSVHVVPAAADSMGKIMPDLKIMPAQPMRQ